MKIKHIITALMLAVIASGSAMAQKSERGIATVGKGAPVIASKGTWMFGGSLKGSYYTGSNYELAILNQLDGNGYGASIKPTVMYLVADNFGIGVRGSYKRNMADITSAYIAVGEGMDAGTYYSLNQSYGGAVFARYFIPIGSNGRLSIIGDLVLGGEAGTSKFAKSLNGPVEGTFQNTWKANVDVDFGMMAFITKHFALEAELGILGFGMNGAKSTGNQVYEGSYNTMKPYFDVDFMSLTVGAFLYF